MKRKSPSTEESSIGVRHRCGLYRRRQRGGGGGHDGGHASWRRTADAAARDRILFGPRITAVPIQPTDRREHPSYRHHQVRAALSGARRPVLGNGISSLFLLSFFSCLSDHDAVLFT